MSNRFKKTGKLSRKRETGRTIKEGDIFFLMGSPTKVKVVGYADYLYPECIILETGIKSFYKVGQVARISCKVLYPSRGKTHARSNVD